MSKQNVYIVCICILAMLQSGCGFMIARPKECDHEIPSTDIHDVFWAKNPHWFSSQQRVLYPPKEQFLKDWGEPDRIEAKSQGKETWVYERSLWCGFIPVIFLPVPLMLPVCDGFDRVEFEGDSATKIHTRSTCIDGGVIPAGETFTTCSGSPCQNPIIKINNRY